MQLKSNKKGMTLIEIVVVLLISTIIMSIVGSMILSSMGYFSEEVVSQQDKDGLADISSYMRKELSYATDVRVATTKPTEEPWHWLSIKEGKLYKDDKQLLSDNYYQNRKIAVKVHGFDNYRLDITSKYLDNSNSIVATNKTSLELMNLRADKNIDREYAPFSTAMDINETQKIYYIIKEKVVTEEPEEPDTGETGTVEDELACLNNYNNRETFVGGTKYNVGDYVKNSDGYWWVNIYTSREFAANEAPGSRNPTGWKKLSIEFDQTSAYEVGDVVIYKLTDKLVYYRAKKLMTTWAPTPSSSTTDSWEYLGEDKPKTTIVCKSLINEQKLVTVRNELDDLEVEKIAEFNNNQNYKVNDIVKVTDAEGKIKYYTKIANGNGKPGTNAGTGWKHLARDFDETSAYKTGDVLLYLKNGVKTITFKKDMQDSSFNITKEIQNADSWGGSEYIDVVKIW